MSSIYFFSSIYCFFFDFNAFFKLLCNVFTILDDEYVGIACGLYLQASNINHSCSPNASCSFDFKKGNLLLIKSICNISSGDDITISYIERMQPSRLRKSELRASFYFDCSCPACIQNPNELDKIMEGYKCKNSECSGYFRIIDPNNLVNCNQCNEIVKISELKILLDQFLNLKSNEWQKKLKLLDDLGAFPQHLDRVHILENAFHSFLSVGKLSDALEVAILRLQIISGNFYFHFVF